MSMPTGLESDPESVSFMEKKAHWRADPTPLRCPLCGSALDIWYEQGVDPCHNLEIVCDNAYCPGDWDYNGNPVTGE